MQVSVADVDYSPWQAEEAVERNISLIPEDFLIIPSKQKKAYNQTQPQVDISEITIL